MNDYVIKTERLLLRHWCEEDIAPFAELNADPKVMEYFQSVKSYQETLEEFARIKDGFTTFGWGLWAASLIDDGTFIGFIGLTNVGFTAPFTPAVEIGWRLNAAHWGKGYATEGAKAVLNYGFAHLELNEIVSYTAVGNTRSRHVMEKIEMIHDEKNDFDLSVSKLPEGHPLRKQVLYRIKAGYFTKISEIPPENFKPRVAVAACYVEVDGKILLMKRSPGSVEEKTWGVAAGKVEAGETPLQGAIRELFEETGITISPSQIEEIGTLYMQKPRGDYTYYMFHVPLSEIPTIHLSKEHTEYVWAGPKERETLDLVGGGKESLHYYARKIG